MYLLPTPGVDLSYQSLVDTASTQKNEMSIFKMTILANLYYVITKC